MVPISALGYKTVYEDTMVAYYSIYKPLTANDIIACCYDLFLAQLFNYHVVMLFPWLNYLTIIWYCSFLGSII